jgi:hypothetical protein
MSYLLNSSAIRPPASFDEDNGTQFAQQTTLQGSVGRDYFGSNKRVWTLTYENVNVTDYQTIKTIYDSYLATNTAKTWQVTETNYTVSSTYVHIDLTKRSFATKGDSYLSSFTLVLTEA